MCDQTRSLQYQARLGQWARTMRLTRRVLIDAAAELENPTLKRTSRERIRGELLGALEQIDATI